MINKLGLKITSTALLLASQIAVVGATSHDKTIAGVKIIALEANPNIPGIVDGIVNWGFSLLVGVAAIFIIWAAFLYLTGGAVEDNIKKAKNFILYAVIALVVGFLAKGLVATVATLLGVKP